MTDNVLRDVHHLSDERIVGHLWLAVVAASKVMQEDEIIAYVKGVLGVE